MLAGSLAVGLTWLAWVGLILEPNGMPVPLGWPALLLATGLAWLQALLWTPFGWPFVRLVVIATVAGGFLAVTIVCTNLEANQFLLAGLIAVLLPPAYLTAYRGVAHGRRGDVPDWQWPSLRQRIPTATESHPFASAGAAQGWLEWRCHGWTFLIMLVWLLAVETGVNILVLMPTSDGLTGGERIAMLMPFTREASLTWMLFHPLALYPLFLALTFGINMGKLGDAVRPSAFLLTRPASTFALVTAKMRVAAWTTLTALGLSLLAAGGWLLLPGAAVIVAGWWRQVLEMVDPVRAWSMIPLAVAAVAGMAWLQTCQGFVFGFIGRAWAKWLPAVTVFLLVGAVVVGKDLWTSPRESAWMWDVLPWLASGVVVVKLALLAWVLKRVLERRLWPPRPLVLVVSIWLLTAGSLIVLMLWLVPPESVPVYLLALIVVSMTPLVRFCGRATDAGPHSARLSD